MAKVKPILDVLAIRSRNETIYAAIIESGSIRSLAKAVGLGEATIRDVLKERRGKVQSNTVISKIERYYNNKQATRTKDYNEIKKQIKRLPPANQRQIAVKGIVFDYKKAQGLTDKKKAMIPLKGDNRRRAFLLRKEKVKIVEIKPNQQGIAVLSQLYLNSSQIQFKG